MSLDSNRDLATNAGSAQLSLWDAGEIVDRASSGSMYVKGSGGGDMLLCWSGNAYGKSIRINQLNRDELVQIVAQELRNIRS
jgi:hypothetical protein